MQNQIIKDRISDIKVGSTFCVEKDAILYAIDEQQFYLKVDKPALRQTMGELELFVHKNDWNGYRLKIYNTSSIFNCLVLFTTKYLPEKELLKLTPMSLEFIGMFGNRESYLKFDFHEAVERNDYELAATRLKKLLELPSKSKNNDQ